MPRTTAVLLLFLASRAFGAWPPSLPAQLLLTVRENAGIARTGEIVRSGVPIPRSLNVTTTAGLAVVDGSATLVPAEFRILARWNAGLAVTSAPIQWLLVAFPATVAANSSATYRVVFDGSSGSNPAPGTPLTLSQNGNQVTVNTGAATFIIGGGAGALFDEIQLAGGTRVVSGSTITGQVNSNSFGHSTTRRVAIESSGPLSAVVVIEGTYAMAAVGSPGEEGGLGSRRRYVFHAGSPVAQVRQSAAWEGDLCDNSAGAIECNSAPNAVRVQQLRDALSLDLAYPVNATASGAFSTTTTGTIAATETAAVRQLLRQNRTDAHAFNVSLPGVTAVNGQLADGGMLAVSSNIGAVAVALERMHRYEPQALRVLSDGRLAIDLVDTAASGGSAWLASRQGLFAHLAVGALASGPSRATLDRQVWAPLNFPLHAWAEPAWFAASEAVDEFPVGGLAPDFTGYDAKATTIRNTTVTETTARGLGGVMTFGLYPRNWANPLYLDEVACGGDDVTPAETWDETYWCSTWTDYHNTVAAIPKFAMRNGQTAWLDELARPGALRSLHTQILQCSPTDNYFYCGQAPAGYGGYRLDFNSSHAYFDNLMLYYWLTGDYSVVEMLQRGATPMRGYYCTRRPASPCLATDLPTDDYSNVNGRVFVQWHSVFRFVGLAGTDGSFLDDYRNNIAREFTHNYAELLQTGIRYGFLIDGTLSVTVATPGNYSTDQLWMASLYDMNLLYRLQRDTNNAAIGSPALVPSAILEAWGRTLTQFGSTVAGNGTAAGTWPNALFFSYTGARIGGALTSVTANQNGSDPNLYETGKAAITATLTRAADSSGEAAMTTLSNDLAEFSWNAANNDPSPLSKGVGEYYARLPAAIARISLALTPPTPAGVTATATSATSINVIWSAVAGATSYQVDRRSAGFGFLPVGTPAVTNFTDTVAANTAHLYRVRAVTATGTSADSASDLATSILFTDDPLVTTTTTVKAVHITQLRTAINAVRALADLTASTFTDPTLNATIPVRRLHITDLRTALDVARSALLLTALTYAEPAITAGTTTIKSAHVTELRNGVR